jgi:hypothetical protein
MPKQDLERAVFVRGLQGTALLLCTDSHAITAEAQQWGDDGDMFEGIDLPQEPGIYYWQGHSVREFTGDDPFWIHQGHLRRITHGHISPVILKLHPRATQEQAAKAFLDGIANHPSGD